MKLAKTLIIIGMTIGALGWISVAALDMRPFGLYLFYVGFLIVAAGVVSGNLGIANLEDKHIPGRGIRVSAIGFGIACTSLLVELLAENESVANYIFYVGFAIVIIGICLVFYDIAVKPRGGKKLHRRK